MNCYITDKELLQAIKSRLDFTAQMLNDNQSLTDELKSVNDRLIASEQMKTGFLSNIRNELNNPIASVLELSNCMLNEEMEIHSIRKFSSMLHTEAFNLDFQLRNIILSAEIEAGEVTITASSIQISSFIHGILDSFGPVLRNKGITLQHEDAIGPGQTFRTDPEKLHIIIRNLISNAINFNKEHGSILVTSNITDHKLIFSVADTGIGIKHEHFPRIFDRFYQAEQGTNKSYAGHGLGLTVTSAALELLNGNMEVTSECDKGSVFRIEVPPCDGSPGDATTRSSEGNEFLFGAEMEF